MCAYTVQVENLAKTVSDDELAMWFFSCGLVEQVVMKRDRRTGRPTGCAVVSFRSPASVPLALKKNGDKLHGWPIVVKPTCRQGKRVAHAT